jgi:HD-like signal output (HDOD) protein
MVPKGKFDWYSPDKSLSQAANSIFNQLTNIDQLPYIPTLIMQFQSKLQDEDTDTPELASLAKQEPILASEIIALANRLKNSRNPDSGDISTIEHAITYVGRAELKDYTLAISIKNFALKTKTFNSDQFWEDAFIRGAIAENLVKDLGLTLEKDQAYLAATLCNVGKIVGAILFPGDIDSINDTINDPSSLSTWKNAETKFPKANHSILGEIGTALWGLPSYIMTAARYHHRSVETPNSLKGDNCIAELAALSNIITHSKILFF